MWMWLCGYVDVVMWMWLCGKGGCIIGLMQKSNYESEDAWVADLDPIMDGKYKVAFFEPLFPLEIRRQISNN